MTEEIIYKYSCVDRLQEIIKNCKDEEAIKLIIELYDLIVYQRRMIKDQRIEIVAIKHKNAWEHYERPISEYDTEQKKHIDKPAKSGNMSC